ncbi:MAG: hypothetical protein F6K35_37740, partial [Okeania sp. SIO2H7]|nr:hypothetical protein [Okeania sp. SIO2H7]
MARVNSPWKFRGTISGITFDKNGIARKAPDARKITAARTLENNNEFKTAAQTGKAIRQAISALEVKDRYITARMVSTVRQGMNLDSVNRRGSRVLSRTEAIAVLPQFELNNNTRLQTVMPSIIKTSATNIEIDNLLGNPITPADITLPEGATHVEIRALTALINPTTNTQGTIKIGTSGIQTGTTALAITPALPVTAATDPEILIVGIAIKFY